MRIGIDINLSAHVGVGQGGGSLGNSLLDCLLWYYTLNESSGVRVDSGPGALNLSQTGTVTNDVGVIDDAAKFNGLSINNLSHAFDSAYVLADFTFTGWFVITNKTADRMIQYIGTGADANNDRIVEIAFEGITDSFKVSLSDGSVSDIAREDIGGTIPTDEFIFYAVRWDNTTETLEIRLNGQPFTSFSFSRTPHTTGTQSFVLGSNANGGDPWISLVDEIGGWDRKLSDAEIDFLYNGGNGQRPNFQQFIVNADGDRIVNADADFIIT